MDLGKWIIQVEAIFIINQKDPQTLYKIKKLIGYGTITGPYFNKNAINSYHRYRVANLKGTEKLIGIFNGNLVLFKTKHGFSEYWTLLITIIVKLVTT